MARDCLKKACMDAGMAQKEVTEYLGISERYYRSIELGERRGDFEVWDSIEDLFGIHQRILRKLSSD